MRKKISKKKKKRKNYTQKKFNSSNGLLQILVISITWALNALMVLDWGVQENKQMNTIIS